MSLATKTFLKHMHTEALHFSLDYNACISISIITVLLKTGMKVYNFTIIISPHYLVKLNTT